MYCNVTSFCMQMPCQLQLLLVLSRLAWSQQKAYPYILELILLLDMYYRVLSYDFITYPSILFRHRLVPKGLCSTTLNHGQTRLSCQESILVHTLLDGLVLFSVHFSDNHRSENLLFFYCFSFLVHFFQAFPEGQAACLNYETKVVQSTFPTFFNEEFLCFSGTA